MRWSPAIRAYTLLAVALASLTLLAAANAAAGEVSAGEASLSQRDTAAVTFRVTVPASTPPGDPVFIAGDFQGWNPGDPAHELADLGGVTYEITLDLTVGATIEFKFTRGSWATVEKGSSGEELPNRTHPITGAETVELTVANWADLPASTITGDVTTHTVPGFLSGRRVWVYLPPDYHARTDQRYPVLYMFDGQNLFDQATSFAGEWEVDETCEDLISAELITPIIVVGVDNGGLSRIYEYTPWYDPGYADGGGGEAHLQEFRDVLLPWVNTNYRTLAGASTTGLAGSSLGGLMSLYGAYAHSDVFGIIGALSPSIWWSDQELLSYAAGQPKPPSTVYMDMGTLEGGIDDLRAMRDVMVGQGFVLDDDLMVVEAEGGEHNEWHWAQRFPGTLQFLFPPPETSVAPPGDVPAATLLRPNAPNPFALHTTLRLSLPARANVRLTVHDVAGRCVRELFAEQLPAGPHESIWDGRDDRGVRAASGIYFYRVQVGESVEQRKMVLLR